MYTNADLIHVKVISENFPFLILRILELYIRKICKMFAYKHTETTVAYF